MIRSRVRAILSHSILEVILVAICIYLHYRSDEFLTIENWMGILRRVAEFGIIAFGMTMVIIAGEIDFCVGSAAALSGCVTAYAIGEGAPVPLAIAMALMIGAAGGVLIGGLRAFWNVPTFITSLALLTGLRGAAQRITDSFPIPVSSSTAGYAALGSGYVLGVPAPAIMLLATFLIVHAVMNYTTFGRSVYAVGGNAEAARLCGINVVAVRVIVLAATGVLAALSGVVLSAKMMSGDPRVAVGWELDVIAAVIVGGTSLSGGVGRVWGTLVGLVFIGVIINGMTLLNWQEDAQLIARGAIILLAVLLSRIQQDRAAAA